MVPENVQEYYRLAEAYTNAGDLLTAREVIYEGGAGAITYVHADCLLPPVLAEGVYAGFRCRTQPDNVSLADAQVAAARLAWRQELLFGRPSQELASIAFILGEAALRIAGKYSGQLMGILKRVESQEGRMQVHVLPDKVRLHPFMAYPFTWYTKMTDGGSDAVVMGEAVTMRIDERPRVVTAHANAIRMNGPGLFLTHHRSLEFIRGLVAE